MSETLTAPAPEAPAIAPIPVTPATQDQASIPTIATGTAPEAVPSEAAPAPSSPEPPSSLLSAAKSETALPPAEAPAAETPAQEAAPEPVPLPSYEQFTLPEGVTLEEAQLGQFTGLLGEYERRLATTPAEAHQATQELGQKLIDLYVAETRTNIERVTEANRLAYQRMREQWLSDFRDDPQIGQNRQDTTVARCGAVLELYGSRVGAEREQALRDVMALTGAGDNPEVLRFINWAANFVVESARPVPAQGNSAPVMGSRAQRLYRHSIPMNGAA